MKESEKNTEQKIKNNSQFSFFMPEYTEDKNSFQKTYEELYSNKNQK